MIADTHATEVEAIAPWLSVILSLIIIPFGVWVVKEIFTCKSERREMKVLHQTRSKETERRLDIHDRSLGTIKQLLARLDKNVALLCQSNGIAEFKEGDRNEDT